MKKRMIATIIAIVMVLALVVPVVTLVSNAADISIGEYSLPREDQTRNILFPLLTGVLPVSLLIVFAYAMTKKYHTDDEGIGDIADGTSSEFEGRNNICEYCGSKVPKNAHICPQCGAPFK